MKHPKEYAKELVDKYLPLVRNSDLYDTYFDKAKQCALKAVDEMINNNILFRDSINYAFALKFYDLVKTEIINLK